jgi:anhydro-N-acetylmuramic acid kinase
MSGTSLDGLDIALCEVKGANDNTSLNITEFITVPYTNDFKALIHAIFAKPNARHEDVCEADAVVASTHAEMVLDALTNWGLAPSDIDAIASHGQTVLHSPNADYPSTRQIGDGDRLAYLTGILTLSDFRQKHIAAGGEGAPLAPYADYLLFANANENRLLLNIGGIANFTYIAKNKGFESVISTDTGPGNTLMDGVIFKHTKGKQSYDDDGKLAQAGNVDDALLTALLAHPFFNQPAPKSTGQETFNLAWLTQVITKKTPSLSLADILATLNLFTAKSITKAMHNVDTDGLHIYVSGGGAYNSALMRNLREQLPIAVIQNSEVLGINADAKEAALFALLANQTLFGDCAIFAGNDAMPAVSMGKLSFP